MNQLISAVGSRLASLYGPTNVYFGDAEESATFPYQVYSMTGSFTEGYATCNRDATARTATSIQISVWSKSSTEAGSRIDTLRESLLNTLLTMTSYKLLRTNLVDESVFVDPDREQDGQRVWQGVLILEFVWNKGA